MYNFLSFFIALSWVAQVASAELSPNKPAALLPKQVLNLSNDERISTNVLLADKNKRRLTYVERESLLSGNIQTQFNIDIGKKSGDKKKKDDKRTPEGIYILQKKMTPPEIPFETYGSMAFTTNYPNFFDRNEKKTGSGIWLHSVPDSVPLTRGSRGCVVLRNNDIRNIDPIILLNKTFLIIDSKIKWMPEDEHQKEKTIALGWLGKWKSLWETQDIDNYIQLYSDEFSSPPFNKKTWYQHKLKLKDKYTTVQVQLSEPSILQIKNQYVFQFVQNYESNSHKDVGIKSLYVLKEGDKLKIAREEWSELK